MMPSYLVESMKGVMEMTYLIRFSGKGTLRTLYVAMINRTRA